jgi:hypothetical protein
VWLLNSKGGDENLSYLIWGMMLGTGAAIGAVGLPMASRGKRLAMMLAWFAVCYPAAFLLLWSEVNRGAGSRMENALGLTLICGFPALLALLVWVVRKPKPEAAAPLIPDRMLGQRTAL